MKNLFSRTAFIVALLAVSISAKAQTTNEGGLKLTVGPETGLSTGRFNETHKSNFGGSVQLELPVAKKWSVNANVGYINFHGRDDIAGTNVNAKGIRTIPATVGVKYFLVSELYVQANAGASFVVNRSDVGYSNAAAFLYSPQIGYQFPLSKSTYLDADIRYQGTSTFADHLSYGKISQFGLRVAFGFGL